MKKISVEELKKIMDDSGEVQLVDVRSSQEYLSARITQAQFTPITHFDHYAPLLDREREVYAMCGGGGRAGEFCRMLERLGGYSPVVVEGGMRAWMERGYPVEIGPKQMWSLERQTRFGAGLLVLLGVVLGAVAHPGFFLLSGFIGLGLMFAAVTNFCGFSILLSKMPWNKQSEERPESGSAAA